MVRHGSKNKLKKTRVTKRLDWVYEPYGGIPVSSNTPVENLEVRVNVKLVSWRWSKWALRLSRRLVHALTFEVGFYFRSLTTTKPIIREAPIYLEQWSPTIRFICWGKDNPSKPNTQHVMSMSHIQFWLWVRYSFKVHEAWGKWLRPWFGFANHVVWITRFISYEKCGRWK